MLNATINLTVLIETEPGQTPDIEKLVPAKITVTAVLVHGETGDDSSETAVKRIIHYHRLFGRD